MTNKGFVGFPSTQDVVPDGSITPAKLAAPGGFGRLSSARYYITASLNASTTTATHGVGTLKMSPWIVPNPCALSRIGAAVTVTGDSGSLVRLGVYADDGTGYPGALVLDAGTIAGDSATVQEITVTQRLTAGLYWIGGAVQVVTTTQPTVVATNAPPVVPIPLGVQPSATGTTVGLAMTGATGALPSVFSQTVSTTGNVLRVFVKVA